MRLNIVHPGAGELRYEIRGIVEFGHKLATAGLKMKWENIGDPVAKGEDIPKWIRDIVAEEVGLSSKSYAYSPTKGLEDAREFLAKKRSEETGVELSADNILFFNGLGDAITKVYTWLNPIARVLGPNPAYPTHSSIEGAHGRSLHLTYNLNPDDNWLPDVEDVRVKVKREPSIAALLVINPDNPTGMIYPRHILEEFVKIAKEHDLFLIADEIYANLAYNKDEFISLANLSQNVPTMIMRGLSKEVPWPGSRCGWVEFYNTASDKDFATYAKSIEEAKMTEVCSTTLPQTVLPKILGDSRYEPHLTKRRATYQKRAKKATRILNDCPAFKVVEPKGAFYLSVTFTDEFMKKDFKLPAANNEAQKLLDTELAKIDDKDFDKIFCYRLMAATGICTVPLTTGFNSSVAGFRMTILEQDDKEFEKTLREIVESVS